MAYESKQYSLGIVVSETHTAGIEGLGESGTRVLYRHLRDHGIEVHLYETVLGRSMEVNDVDGQIVPKD